METLEQLKSGDISINIDQSSDCISLLEIDVDSLAEYIVASSNSNGRHLIIGSGRTEIIGVKPDSFSSIFAQAKSLCSGVDVNLEFIPNIRGNHTLGVITVKPSIKLASVQGIVYELENNTPRLMSEPEILTKIGLGVDSELINSLAVDIASQSRIIESLQTEIKRASSYKGQWKSWVIGALFGFFISELLKLVFGLS
ncbi:MULTISPECIES: hypothetical protein [unclassified Pseudoalteromonas]|uniref:hypothetical protein n=1 Tax=unclassified Pseudoalteromonas TaxID=194690 RepID=UPI0025B623CB|nr:MULTISPECIES: hypothetical protein [unclassified Pseudoalteromonas]MDN3379179.1 hypothetical protein [Pseudoalteromonas sp. APC 3893]MDN3387674.1 hypothetical protein [Pseudoalteromonas sp. APC 4017]